MRVIKLLILNLADDLISFFDPIVEFFKDVYGDIQSFFLQYMSLNVFNILIFGILVAIILIVVLAVMNRNQ